MLFRPFDNACRLLLVLAPLLFSSGHGFASEKGPETAALTTGQLEADEAGIPRLLAESDESLYRDIFTLQEEGEWKEADRLIGRLENRELMGHVLAQRYLHRDWRSKFADLSDWMKLYHDHPEAGRIFELAKKRRPKNVSLPRSPSVSQATLAAAVQSGDDVPPRPHKTRSAVERSEARAIQSKIRNFARRGWTKAIRQTLEDKRTARVLSSVEYDEARAQLATGYFVDGRDDLVMRWAEPAGKRSGTWVPQANWIAGLSSWRQGKFTVAASFFEAASMAPGQSPWTASAAAFWAARAHLIDMRPERVNVWLDRAAEYPRTFYGILAGRLLGRPMPFRWASPDLEGERLARLADFPAGRRALGLVQVGQDRRAERELRAVVGGLEPELRQSVMALAAAADMPGLSMRLGGMMFNDGNGYMAAAYPIPRWEPEGGFSVDRALVFALIRQESAFNPNAKSHAGASGLMQLMPRTASFVANDRSLRGKRKSELFDPERNLTLGQRFIEMLLADPNSGGDLFQLAAAWNGGPGNLNKWLRQNRHGDDPLLFIESIPLRETRMFIERVLANLWIYRHRFGQATPSLDALAAGERPVYVPLDRNVMTAAAEGFHGQNRR